MSVLPRAGTGLVAALVLGTGAAFAQEVVPAGQTLEAPPDINDQVRLNDNSTLLMRPGGTVTNAAGDAVIDDIDGITINVDNAGSIVSNTADAVESVSSTLDLVNRGTGVLTGGDIGVNASTIQSLVNRGAITGLNNHGVTAGVLLQSLVNSGTITGTDNGVFATSLWNLTNSGTITGDDDGVNGGFLIESLTNSGAITGGAEGVEADTIEILTNSGAITGAGDGINADTLEALTNSGAITGGDDGVDADAIGSLTNTGTIAADSFGILTASVQNLTNSGTITSVNSDGIFSTTMIQSLVNSGAITGADVGISADTAQSLVNRGTISGGAGQGVAATFIQTLVNTGAITGGDNGIFADTVQTLTNSGFITGGEHAIRVFGANDTTLTLAPGSVIVGPIDLGGGTNTLNVRNGLSITNTFDGGPPQAIAPNGAPFAVNGNRVAVADPTNLAAQDEFLTDLTGSIFSTVRNRLNGFGQGGVSGVTANPRAMSIGGGAVNHTDLAVDTRRQAWAQGFGSYRLQRGREGPAVDADVRLGGLVSGLDGPIGAGGRAGVFFGGSWGDVDADYDSQQTDVESIFGGVYARWLRGRTRADFAFTAGYSEYDRERRVANNTTATGLETATADYDGWFVSPELTLTRPMWVDERRFEKSVTLRYAGLFLDGFTESGIDAPLTVDDRNIHVLQARTQLTMPNERVGANGVIWRDALYIGLEGRANVGDDDVSGALLARNITFDPGGDDVVGGAFAGFRFERTSASGTTLYAAVEGQVETGGGRQASAKAGMQFRF